MAVKEVQPDEIQHVIWETRHTLNNWYSGDASKCAELRDVVSAGLAALRKENPPNPDYSYSEHVRRLSDRKPAVPSEYARNLRSLLILKKVMQLVTQAMEKAEPQDAEYALCDAKHILEKYEEKLGYITDIYRNHIESLVDALRGMENIGRDADAEPFKTHRLVCWKITNEAADEFRKLTKEFASEFGVAAAEMFAEEYNVLQYMKALNSWCKETSLNNVSYSVSRKDLQPTEKGTQVVEMTKERMEKNGGKNSAAPVKNG